jgi:methylmalonyl-CoA mutase N-terminal domain/subunit
MAPQERATPSGLVVEPFLSDAGGHELPELPGEFPYGRGIFPTGYRHAKWMESFASGYGLPETTNRYQHRLRQMGHGGYGDLSSMNLVFDRPTFEGFDSDHPLARHEVGEVGVLVDSIHDVERIFQGFELDQLNVGIILDRSGPPVLAMYLAVAEERRTPWTDLRGIVTNNPLEGYFISRMKLYPPRATLRMTADLTKFCIENVPRFNTCRVNGYSLRETGATAVQEVAFALAKGLAIIEECVRRGVAADDAASRTSFQFAQDSYFLEEIAKIRAGRRIWAKLLRERLDVRSDKSCRMKIHMQTSGASLVAQEPLNNIVRVALQTLSAQLAGAQSVHICAYDEALGIPTEEAVRIAIKTSKIVQHESGMGDFADPLGGSYVLEDLTSRLEVEVMEELERIDSMGGVIGAIDSRYFEQEIVDASAQRQAEIESGARTIIGLNAYAEKEALPSVPVFRVDPEDRALAIERCKALKRDRDARKAEMALGRLQDAAADEMAPVFPHLLECVKADITIGEICNGLAEVFGEWSAPPMLARSRA